MRWCFVALLSVLWPCLSNGQVRDTTRRDIGVNLTWRSLATSYTSINSGADVVGNFQLGVEVRAWHFWVQTGAMFSWNQHRPVSHENTVQVFASICYEFPVFKKRVVLGVGPIVSYYHYSSKATDWNGNTSLETNLGSVGLNFEISVPIYKGLSVETCSDIGVGFNRVEIVPRIVRLVSIGINYRFKAYPQ